MTYGREDLDIIGLTQSLLNANESEDQAVAALGIEPPSFVLDAWNPTREEWPHYKRRVLKRVKDDLAKYREGIEGLEALAKSPRSRSRDDRGADQHLRWLVRFQVLEERQQAIADDPTGDGSGRVELRTVQDGIRSARQRIELTRTSVRTHE